MTPAESPAALRTPAPPSDAVARPLRALVAEDERATAHLLTTLLRGWAYDVTAVGDGHVALETFVGDENIQLLLLDWMLPGLDGLEICRRIRELRGDRPVYIILLTSRRDPADVIAGLHAGADDYLIKPFNHHELQARLLAGARVIALQDRLAMQVRELEGTLARVRRLSGLLPICSYCKSIRDDANDWHRVEAYVSEHANVRFTHGICPQCLPRAHAEMRGDGDGGPPLPQGLEPVDVI